jgi:hypothetical protein
MYEFGMDILTSHWKTYENETEMRKDIKEWEEKNGNSCVIFDGNYNPYDDTHED